MTASFGSRGGASLADLLFPLIFAPTILTITPSSGPLSGGTTVDIAGFNFTAGATVTFDGVLATAIVVTPAHIFCNTPAHAIGAVNVVVTNPDLQTATLVNGFSYMALIVAVGLSVAVSSPDGITWTTRAIPAGTYNSVAWNGALYATVGASVAATSPDGITWTARTIPAGSYTGIAWNGSVFAAVGANLAATSLDGITWTAQVGPTSGVNDVAWNGAVFCTVGGSGPTFTSPDGVTWTQRGSAGSQPALSFSTTTGLFAAVTGGNFRTSTNAVTWAVRVGPAFAYTCIARSPSLYAAAGNNALNVTSPDGITWTSHTTPTQAANRKGISWTGDKFSIVGTNHASYSLDGATWVNSSIPAGDYTTIASPLLLPL